MRIQTLIIFLFFFISFFPKVFSQTKSEWFPSELNIHPFTANFLEPKAGSSYLIDKSKLRLDIGTSSDIYRYYCDEKTFSVGGDFFTFTRLRSEKEFHFPVEAIDYLFGLNAGYKIGKKNYEYGLRFRLSHISAHFVDGQFDFSINDWRNGRNPRVYSREFVEFFPYYRIKTFRAYAGLTYLFHSSPDFVGKGIYQLGFDYFLTSIFKSANPFIAYDFKLTKIGKFQGNNIISLGVKFGTYNKKGFSILLSYFSGKSVHGEYFDLNESYAAFGFNMDL